MATLIWTGASAPDNGWFTAANWTPQNVPAAGDILVVRSGTPTVGENERVLGEQIILGGLSSGSAVTLVAENGASFEPVVVGTTIVNDLSLTVTGGDPGAPVTAKLFGEGGTTFAGQIVVEAIAGTLTIRAGSPGDTLDNFIFTDSASARNTFVLVAQESALLFEGEQITTAGVIEVEGIADIAEGVTFGGSGIVVLDDGGRLSIEGTVAAGQQIDFFDGTGKVTIANAPGTELPDFHGIFGFTNLGGARIDLTGVQAQSFSVDDGGQTLTLSTAHGPVSFGVRIFDPETLDHTDQALSTGDFAVTSDGNGGTLITYTPQGPTFLQASLPVPVVATAGTLVPLSTILMQSFGTTTPSPYGITLLTPDVPSSTSTNYTSWVNPNIPPATNIAPAWYVNGVLQSGPYTVQPGDIVQLLVGNNIIDPAQIQVQVTPTATDTSGEFVIYNIWPVDPNVAALVEGAGAQAGQPTPADIIASAESWNTTFGNVPNTSLCDWIADNVAAGAGVPMPFPNALPDPSFNVSGGFWRIVYTGAGPSPVQDWYTLVQPGDIVRMEWFRSSAENPNSHIGVHTTTVLGAVNADGQITVYDNVDHVILNGMETETIGIHTALYWPFTDPASITIYRLDPNQQYLIQGTSLVEVIQGSVYDDLIQPGGGADTITGGPGDNEIQDTTAHLNGITVTDFGFGDAFDFTDLNPAQAAVAFAGTTLQVFMSGVPVATITLPELPSTGTFVVTPDGSGGSRIELDPSAAPWTFLASGDFNGDGITDLMWLDPTTGNTIEWLMSPNGGVGGIPATPPVTGWNLVATGDFNGDGITDLMWENASTGATSEWLMAANGGLGSNPATPPVTGWDLIATGDFNGDGITDLMWEDASTGATSEWLMAAGGGMGSNPATPPVTGWYLLATGDFTGDGIQDLMWKNAPSGVTSEWVMSAAGGMGSNPVTPGGQGWDVVATGDFSGSGITDLMWQNPLSGATSDWLMSATGGLGSNPFTPGANGWNVIATADFSGDGVKDLMWQNTLTGATSEWLMSAGGFSSNPFTPGAQGWNLVATGDFNGDGITDLMWQNASTGATSEWLMSAGGFGSNPATPSAQDWKLVTTGDFNHDGIQDLMWQNASTGATSEWLMSADGGLASNPSTPPAAGTSGAASMSAHPVTDIPLV